MGTESEPPVDVPTRPGPGPPGPGSEHPPPGPVTEAAGSRSAAIAGNVDRGVVITGDYNVVHQYFVQHYPSLKDYIYDFDEEKKLAERFVGRDELFRRLGDFARRPCGYFRVVADAGLGKTALAAAAAKRLKAPVFFANQSRGLTRPDQCLNHLAVELIARFDLIHHARLSPLASENSKFFGKILAEAAARAEGPLWIVVDALEEAEPLGPGRNPLLLPDRLPCGAYMLLTHRPGDISLRVAPGTADEEYCIATSDAAQQADIEAYLRQEADRPEILRAREAPDSTIPIDRFIAVLKDKSEGNFKYLEYVLDDIRAQEPGFDRLELESLPRGLRNYYREFWRRIEHVGDQDGWAEWNSLYRPVITFLATAREAVTAPWLGAMIGRPADEIEHRALRPWRQFLSQEDRGQENRRRFRRWRVVHQSFVDFLDEEDMVDLLDAHVRVASFYLASWGGLDAGLPVLFDPARREDLDDYGLRHLTEHLERAGRIDDLHRLLRLEPRGIRSNVGPIRAENAWYAVRQRVGQKGGYMNDLARAARLAQLPARLPAKPRLFRICIGLRIRYALISTSLNNLARNIPPCLIAALVGKRVWLASQGLDYARILPPETAVDAMIRISAYLDHDKKEAVIREAFDAAQRIAERRERALAFAKLGRIDEAFGLVRHITEEQNRALTLEELALYLATYGQVEEMLLMTLEIVSEEVRAGAMAALAPRLAAMGRPEEALTMAQSIGPAWLRASALASLGQVREAIVVVRGIDAEGTRALALSKLAPYLMDLEQVYEALAVERGIQFQLYRDHALVALAPRLAAFGRINEALEVVRGIELDGARAAARAMMAPHLASAGRFDEAMEAVRMIRNERERVRAVGALAPHLSDEGHLKDALAMVERIGDERVRAHALPKLIRHLAKEGRPDEALAVARRIGDEDIRARALAELGHLDEALELAQGIGDEVTRAGAIAELAPRLAEAGRLDEALAAAREIDRPDIRAFALVELVPHLVMAGRSDEALAMVREIRDESTLARALAMLGQVDEALALVRVIEDDRDRAFALAGLIPLLPELGRVDEAILVARGVDDDGARNFVLNALALRLAELGRADQALAMSRETGDKGILACTLAILGGVDEALAMAMEVGDDASRAGALAVLAPRLANLPKARALPLWQETLQLSATRSRRDLLTDLAALAPVIASLGGPEAIAEACHAIEDVGRWWP